MILSLRSRAASQWTGLAAGNMVARMTVDICAQIDAIYSSILDRPHSHSYEAHCIRMAGQKTGASLKNKLASSFFTHRTTACAAAETSGFGRSGGTMM